MSTHRHFDDVPQLVKALAAAESRVAELEAGIDAAADALTRWNKPDDELGQSLVVASVTRHLRALLGKTRNEATS